MYGSILKRIGTLTDSREDTEAASFFDLVRLLATAAQAFEGLFAVFGCGRGDHVHRTLGARWPRPWHLGSIVGTV
jgi:hypothetical protein